MVYYAQYHQDEYLERFFGDQVGFFVEAGALDGVYLSNTKHFADKGWTGVLVEPDRRYFAQCVANRPESRCFEAALVALEGVPTVALYQANMALSTLNPSRATEMIAEQQQVESYTVAARTLDSILQEVGPAKVDLLCLDCETMTHLALQGANIERWRPRVLMIECFTQVEHDSVFRQMREAGYTYVGDYADHLFVRDVADAPWLKTCAEEVLHA